MTFITDDFLLQNETARHLYRRYAAPSPILDFLNALRKRHDYFHSHGCRMSDHGLNHSYAEPCGDQKAAAIFDEVRSGKSVTPEQAGSFASYLMLFFGRLDTEKGLGKTTSLGSDAEHEYARA
jgi:glucuronate isomerase